ncbi:hypothetical protein JCM5296_007345 [Sporobolomyces johnsonii]
MSRSTANKRIPSSSASSASLSSLPGSSSAQQTTPSTSHEFRPSPLDPILAQQGLQRYHLEPPSWRAPWITGSVGGNRGNAKGKSDAGGGAAGGVRAWPVFYPTRDGMDEDQLTEAVVKAGFVSKSVVQAETFSAHQHIYDKLKTTDILGNLSRLVSAVQQRADANLPTYGPSTFRLPSRITLTDSKREAWFSDLANPTVPLSKLSRSVPHGYKGEKGLDMLAARKVEVGRAVWFVRAFGGVEIQSLAKSRPLPLAISHYTSEFTTVVCEFVRKQLLDLALPAPLLSEAGPTTSPNLVQGQAQTRSRSTSTSLSASTSGMRGHSDLMDPETRRAWKEKFDYTLRLTTSLLSASLLSTPQFIRFLISLVDPTSTTLAQLSVALLLIEEFWNEILEDEAGTARLVRSCVVRLVEIEQLTSSASSSTLYTSLANSLTSLTRSAFLALPDSLVSLLPAPISPSSSRSLSSTSTLSPSGLSAKLEKILLSPASSLSSDPAAAIADDPEQDPALLETIRMDLADLAARRSAAGGDGGEEGGGGEREKAQLEVIRLLDSLAFPASVSSLHAQLFTPSSLASSTPHPSPDPSAPTPASPSTTRKPRPRARPPILPLVQALPLLFSWATTPTRAPGVHRRYAVGRVVALELEREAALGGRGGGGVSTRSKDKGGEGGAGQNGKKVVEEAFVRWVDERFPPSGKGKENERYLVSRSEVRALAEELIRLGALGYGAYLQRMIARGETERAVVPAEEGEEGEGEEQSIHLWILRTVGAGEEGRKRIAIGGGAVTATAGRTEELVQLAKASLTDALQTDSDCSTLLDAMRQLAQEGAHLVVTREVVPEALSTLADPASGKIALEVEALAVVVAVFEETQDWVGLLQLLIVLLHRCSSPSLTLGIVDTLSGHLDVWTALDGLKELSAALFAAYEACRSSGGTAKRRLLGMLNMLAGAGHLKGRAAEVVAADTEASATPPTARPAQQPPVSSPLVELQTLLIEFSPAAVTQLTATLYQRYHSLSSDTWILLTVDSAIQLLPQMPGIDPVVGLFKALDERMPKGLEGPFVRWMTSLTVNQLATTFGGAGGPALAELMGELVLEGVVAAPMLLREVLLPAWKGLLSSVLPDLAATLGEGTTQPLQLDSTLLQALSTLSTVLSKLIADDTAPDAQAMSTDSPIRRPFTPASLLRRQRHTARLAPLFTSTSLPLLAHVLALLILQQELLLSASLPDAAQSASSLFLHLVGLPAFQAQVIRDPGALRAGILDSEFVKSLPEVGVFRPKLLAGLLLSLKDGGAATPANLVSTEDWDLFLSGLTMWRLAVSKVEVEACLERLELDSTLSTEDKGEALHTLSKHFLERVCAGEGQTYLGEQVVRCYHGAASDELVSVAFARLASAVATLTSSLSSPFSTSAASSCAIIRCKTRLLETLLQSSVASSRAAALQHLLGALKSCLEAMIKAELDAEEAKEVVMLVTNLLGIALRCTGEGAEKETAELYRDCVAPCAQLAVSLAKTPSYDTDLSSVLLDTTSHILFALPDLSPSVRPPTLHSLLSPDPSRPSLTLTLDPHVPDALFTRLTRLFGPYAPTSLVPNPWELLDHADPSASNLSSSITARRPASSTAQQHQLTNAGPLALSAFHARIIESIPPVTALDALSTVSNSSTSSATTTNSQRGAQTSFDFETPCTGLSVAARDHRRWAVTTRQLVAKGEQGAAGLGAGGGANAGAGGGGAQVQQQQGRKRTATGEPVVQAAITTASSTTAAAAASASTAAAAAAPAKDSAAAGTRGTKRKEAPDVLVLDSDEEGTAAPTTRASAKRGRGGATGGKTAATASARGPGRRKSKT